LAERGHEWSPSKSTQGPDTHPGVTTGDGFPLIVLTWTTESLPQVPSAVLVERSRHGLSIMKKIITHILRGIQRLSYLITVK
jgi:hypothetical protein